MAGKKADVFEELKEGLGCELTCTGEAGREGRRDMCKGTQMMFRLVSCLSPQVNEEVLRFAIRCSDLKR